jgi:signal transduction histidine kinase
VSSEGCLRYSETRARSASWPLSQAFASWMAWSPRCRQPACRSGWRIEGPVDDLPKGVDLSAYRIIQEALTNSLKHSSHASVDVLLRRLGNAIELEVQDAGPALNGDSPGVGHGLIGMRERTALYGGVFEAGPRSGGGFDVKVTLPIDPA